MAGFVPTRHELLLLAKEWARVAIDIEYVGFLDDSYGSCDCRLQTYGWRRVDRIAGLVGSSEIKAVIEEVKEDFRSKSPRAWDIFAHGDSGQRAALHEEMDLHQGKGCTCSWEGTVEPGADYLQVLS